MPMPSSHLRSAGLSFTACDASASMAIRPPSPWLSARSTSTTYLIETMTVSVQKKIDRTPYTLAWVKGTCPEPKTSLTAYRTLVPMSP
jgi:hypothetical protein